VARRNALILIAGTLLLGGSDSLCTLRQLATPIVELTAITENISRVIFDKKVIGIERRDEIGALARAIDRMGGQHQDGFRSACARKRDPA